MAPSKKKPLVKLDKGAKSTKITIQNADDKMAEMIDKPYQCTCCGTRYKVQKGNFSHSSSPFFKSNNEYLPVCANCLEDIVVQYTQLLGSESDAIRRVCMKMDIYLNETLIESSRKTSEKSNSSWIRTYIKQTNLNSNNGKTYDTYLAERGQAIVTDEVISQLEDNDARKMERNVEKWGSGYSTAEYDTLNEHYKMLTKRIESMDYVQDKLCRDLSTIKIMQDRAFTNGDITGFDKLIKLYQSTLSTLKLNPDVDNKTEEEACFGAWINDIEKYCPAEYYADKSKYMDFFGIGEYIERFLYRPLKNLITGSKDMDKEFNIDDGED